MGPFSRWSWPDVEDDTNIEGGFRNRAARKSFLEAARKDIQDTLRREGIEKTYEPRVGVWKTKGGKPHPDVSDMDKWGQTPGGKRDLRALKLALEKYPEFSPVELGAVREHWASPKMRSKTAWPAAPSDAPHEIKSTQSPVEMAIWWGPMLAKLGVHAAKKAAQRKLRSEVVKDPSGNPQLFLHGTRGRRTGDLDPTKTRGALEYGEPEQYLSTSPQTAMVYATAERPAVSALPYAKDLTRARIYPKYLRPLEGKGPKIPLYKKGDAWKPIPVPSGDPSLQLAFRQYYGPRMEVHGVVTDPRNMIPPHALAPLPLPNVLPQLAPPLALPYMEP